MPMVWPRSKRSADVRLLGLALLLMSGIAALISARLAGFTPPSGIVDHSINLIGLVSLPLVVLYSRCAVGARITAAVGSLWLPAAGYSVVLAVRAALGFDTRVPFVWLLPIVFGFTAAAAVTLWRGRGSRQRVLIPAEAVVTFIALLNVAQFIRMEFSHVTVVRAVVPLVMSAGFVAIAMYAVWHSVALETSTDVAAQPEPAYERSGLDETRARELLARIDTALTRDRLYARADLTLAELAAALGTTTHHLSEALNRYAGVSFNDVVNRHRVECVKAQLLDPGSERFTIEGIGASAGFGSRSSLYAAFKRFEGTTPTGFRASHRQVGRSPNA
jgi:AraC-like DNA-binding protein